MNKIPKISVQLGLSVFQIPNWNSTQPINYLLSFLIGILLQIAYWYYKIKFFTRITEKKKKNSIWLWAPVKKKWIKSNLNSIGRLSINLPK